jgi:hypothetical protein
MGRHFTLRARRYGFAGVLLAAFVVAPIVAQGHYGWSISEFDSPALLASEGPPAEMGAWYVPPLPPEDQRTQAVHAVLLPNEKVLIVNGSSNRNRIQQGKVEEGIDASNPVMANLVNNTALFDPRELPVEDPTAGRKGADLPTGLSRISSPPATYKDPNWPKDERPEIVDLFCSGHVHQPDGNVLFASGTSNYYGGERFNGTRGAWTFDWQEEIWKYSGAMEDGHWYPSLVPLGDGRIVVFSGISKTAQTNSPWVEFFDPSQPVDKAWTSVDLDDKERFPVGPFTSPVGDKPGKRDRMFNYPRIYPLHDGRLMITGDGAGGGDLKSRNTYLMTIGDPAAPGGPPEVSFVPGPERLGNRKAYSTAVLDPNSKNGDILLFAGMQGSDDINLGPGNPLGTRNYDVRVTAGLERYAAPAAASNSVGAWQYDENFLGEQPSDNRIMHVGVLLPTKEILLVGGGNYAFHDPVVRPQLLTPDPTVAGGYKTKWLNPATQPRLYHTTSLLLPDGRVLVAGGNSTRAVVNLGSGKVELDVIRKADATFARVEAGRNFVPAEIWQMELFYPPYLFHPKEPRLLKEEERPMIVGAPKEIAYGASVDLDVKGMTDEASMVLVKLGSVTHGWDMGQRLVDVAFSQNHGTGKVTIKAPTNRHMTPPGFYMLFYVGQGVPSRAAMIHLG